MIIIYGDSNAATVCIVLRWDFSVSNHRTLTIMIKQVHKNCGSPYSGFEEKKTRRKTTSVRALTDRAKNVCSSPELLAEEMDHLGKVLKYNNYPKWMIDQHGRNSSERRLINPEEGNEVKKSVFISAPYFPGLSESSNNCSNTLLYKFASKVKTPLNQC